MKKLRIFQSSVFKCTGEIPSTATYNNNILYEKSSSKESKIKMPKRSQGYTVSAHRHLSCSDKNKGNLEEAPALGLWKFLMGTGKLCREKNVMFFKDWY